MGEREIYVEDNGQILEKEVTVKPGDKVVWKPRTPGNKIDIFFDDNVPFNAFLDPKWLNKQETNEDKIDGKVKGHKKGTTTRYPYNTIKSDIGPSSGPELIVDGGPGPHLRKKPKVKKAKAAKKTRITKKAKTKKAKTKKTKQLARGNTTKRGKAKKGKARKAAKSRATKKR